jgi:hypothetical protein
MAEVGKMLPQLFGIDLAVFEATVTPQGIVVEIFGECDEVLFGHGASPFVKCVANGATVNHECEVQRVWHYELIHNKANKLLDSCADKSGGKMRALSSASGSNLRATCKRFASNRRATLRRQVDATTQLLRCRDAIENHLRMVCRLLADVLLLMRRVCAVSDFV